MSNPYRSKPGFEIGDIVMLKSGGQEMTVTSVKDEKCDCSFFYGDCLVERTYDFRCLLLADKAC